MTRLRSPLILTTTTICLLLFISLTLSVSARGTAFFRRPFQNLFNNHVFDHSEHQPRHHNSRSHRLQHHPDAAEHRRILNDEHQQHLNNIKQDHERHTRRMNELHQQFQPAAPQVLEFPFGDLSQLFEEPEKFHAATSELLRTTAQLLKTIFDVDLDTTTPQKSTNNNNNNNNDDQSSTQQQQDQQQQQQQDQQQDQQLEQHREEQTSTQDLTQSVEQPLHTFEPTVAPEFKWFSSDKRLLLALYMPGAADLDVSVDDDILSVSARRPIATSVFSTLESIDDNEEQQQQQEESTIENVDSVEPIEEAAAAAAEAQEEEIFKPLSLAFNVKYHAAFRIPRTVDATAISAVSHNGVVFLSLPLKTTQSKVRVNVKSL